MSKALVFLALLAPAAAFAQTAGGYSVEPSKEGVDYRTLVTEKSPAYTQDRVTAGSRYWLLDPGRYEVELWWSDKFSRADALGNHQQSGLLQLEIEIGLAPHLQLDLYQNFVLNDDNGNFGWGGPEGVQVELRYAFSRHYNEIPLNPVLYLEWHPRHGSPDRFEAKLLLGGDITPSLLGIINLYAEANLDTLSGPKLSWANTDAELGLTAALTYAVDIDHFRIGVEGKVGVDQHGNDLDPNDPKKLYPVYMVGPNILLKIPDAQLKLTATCFFGLDNNDPLVYPLLIVGKQW